MNTSSSITEINSDATLDTTATTAPDTNPTPSAHLELLRLLKQHPEHSQRQLAVALGVSLGKTHYLLKALLAKAGVKAQNFKRSAQKAGYLYVLTSQEVSQRLKLTQAFLVRKEQEYEMLKSEIVLLREEVAAQTKGSS